MSNLILIFICMSVGGYLRYSKRVPETAHLVFNSVVIDLAFPALVLLQIPALLKSAPSGGDLWVPVSMAWLLFILAVIIILPLSQALGWSRSTTGALLLTAGLANTSFVGFPLLEVFYGERAIQTGIIVDQAGSFLTLSSLGLISASILSGNRLNAMQMIRRIVYFPPFISLVIAIALYAFEIELFAPLKTALNLLSGLLVPAAMLSVGFQLRFQFSLLKRKCRPLIAGLVFKLLIAPLILTGFYFVFSDIRNFATQITLLEAAMPPMITGAIVAAEFDLDPELANLMIALGIPISFLTVPLWYLFLSAFSA